MIAVHDLEITVGARTLMSEVNFRVGAGDKVGLVGRNGAGKTTLTKVLAGWTHPSAGRVDTSGEIGYLPQDPRAGDPEQTARNRILDARGLGQVRSRLAESAKLIADAESDADRDRYMRRYSRLDDEFAMLGGYAAESEAAAIASNLSLPDRILDQPLRTLSGGQRRRVELARILFSDADTMILDEPTNHLDIDSVVWLREFLKTYRGGLIVISHDVELIGETVNRVFYLDANRQVIDIYNMGWSHYLKQREADEERRRKERANIEKRPPRFSSRRQNLVRKPPRPPRPTRCSAAPNGCSPGLKMCGKPTGWQTSGSRPPLRWGKRRFRRRGCQSRTVRSKFLRVLISPSTAVREWWCWA